MQVVGVSRPRTSGSALTKKGKKAYRGKRKHWYVYFYDDEGHFRKRKITSVQVPYYGSLIRRRKAYKCASCATKFRSFKNQCPRCGSLGRRLERKSAMAGLEGISAPRLSKALRKPESVS